MGMTVNHYATLGVKMDADKDTIKKAWRKLAKQHHPDRNSSGDEAKFKMVVAAYTVLSDPIKRKLHDLSLPVTSQTSQTADYSPEWRHGWDEYFNFGGRVVNARPPPLKTPKVLTVFKEMRLEPIVGIMLTIAPGVQLPVIHKSHAHTQVRIFDTSIMISNRTLEKCAC